MDDLFTHSYHKTVEITSKELENAEAKAKSQDAIVHEFYKCSNIVGWKFTAEQVWKSLITVQLIHDKTPLSSIRRSCSNLAKKGLLKKLDDTVLGSLGSKVHFYKLNNENNHE